MAIKLYSWPQSSGTRVSWALEELGAPYEYVEIDPKYFRPTEVDFLLGDASKARRLLGWEPRVSFRELVRIMVDADLKDLMDLRQCQDVIQRLRQENQLAPGGGGRP